MGLWHTHELPNLGQKTRTYNNKILEKWLKKRYCKIVNFALSVDNRIKLKECEKKDKNFDLARELKKTMEHEADDCAFGTATKGLLKGLEDLEFGGRVETIQTAALLKTARILRRVLETWGDLLSLKLQLKSIS